MNDRVSEAVRTAKKITIAAGRPYDVRIGAGLIDALGVVTASACPGAARAMLVADDTVDALYGDRAAASLCTAGLSVSRFSFPHGEASKTLSTYAQLLNALTEARLSRADVLVALGGGVTGDLTGFAAATYLRGVRFVQAPTTLLAAVDSSVGGKTAVDLPAGKNLVGAFHQPSAVALDTDTFATLPDDTFADGMAEAIKTGVIGDEALFDLLAHGRPAALDSAVARCVEIKGEIVRLDERDTGMRQLLNLGHTVGHAAELLSDFGISHGHAVAIGMAVMARAARAAGLCAEDVPARIEAALRSSGLPVDCPFHADALAKAIVQDKKRKADSIVLVIPERIGHCALRPTPLDALVGFLTAGVGGAAL